MLQCHTKKLSSISNSSTSSQKVGASILAVDFDTCSKTPQNVGSTKPRDVKHTTDNPESDNGCTNWSMPVLLRSKAERLDIAGYDLVSAISNPTPQSHGVTVPDTALLALAIAATLKLLEACHFWTERSSCYSVGHINHALLLKRLDGNLMQG